MTALLALSVSLFSWTQSEALSAQIRQAVETSVNDAFDFDHCCIGIEYLNESFAKMTILIDHDRSSPKMLIHTIATLETYDYEFGDPVSEVEIQCLTPLNKTGNRWKAASSDCEFDHYGLTPGQAISVARFFAHTLDPEVLQSIDTSIEDQLDSVWFFRDDQYHFVMHDVTGDCGLVIVVHKGDGHIIEDETHTDWQCH